MKLLSISKPLYSKCYSMSDMIIETVLEEQYLLCLETLMYFKCCLILILSLFRPFTELCTQSCNKGKSLISVVFISLLKKKSKCLQMKIWLNIYIFFSRR